MTVEATNAVTLGELARRLDTLHGDVRELRVAVVDRNDLQAASASWQMALRGVETACAANLTAHAEAEAARATRLEARVKAIESWGTWAVRVVGGILLTAVLTLVIVRAGAVR